MSRRHRIVMPFVFANLPSFVRADVDVLGSRHDIEVVPSGSGREMLRAARAAWSATVLLCWFGSVRYLPAVLVARLRGVPVVVIAGGYDVACEPGIQYGNMVGGMRKWLGRLLFRLATQVVPYSQAGASEAIAHAFVPTSRMRVIPLGFDASAGADVPIEDKEPFVLSVGLMNESSIRRKGIVTILRAAQLMPEVRFVIVGKIEDDGSLDTLRALAGPNVELAGFLDSARLDALFRCAKVYCQPSVHEAFGCAVAEAMQFNALPVVSDRGSLPEVVGHTGSLVPPNDPVALTDALRTALAATAYPSPTPRAYVASVFPRERRALALETLLEELS